MMAGTHNHLKSRTCQFPSWSRWPRKATETASEASTTGHAGRDHSPNIATAEPMASSSGSNLEAMMVPASPLVLTPHAGVFSASRRPTMRLRGS